MGDLFGNAFGGNPPGVSVPPFTSAAGFPASGGITPEEQALVAYTEGQNLLADEAQFATSGTGESTMKTQAAGGARLGAAEEAGKISDINTTAFYDTYKNAVADWLGQLGTTSTLTQLANQNALKFAGSAGQAFGGGGGGGSSG